MNSRRAFVVSKWLSRLIAGYFTAKSLLSGIYGRILRAVCAEPRRSPGGGRWRQRCSVSCGFLATSQGRSPCRCPPTGSSQSMCVCKHVCVFSVCTCMRNACVYVHVCECAWIYVIYGCVSLLCKCMCVRMREHCLHVHAHMSMCTYECGVYVCICEHMLGCYTHVCANLSVCTCECEVHCVRWAHASV